MDSPNNHRKSLTRRRLEIQSGMLTWAVGLFVAIGGALNGWVVTVMLEIMQMNHQQDIELERIKGACIMRDEFAAHQLQVNRLEQQAQLCNERVNEIRRHDGNMHNYTK